MTSEEKRIWAEELLKNKFKELGRMPKKDDFDEATRSRIKAFLGPWPRALEAAGLKQEKPQNNINHKKRSKSRKQKEIALKKLQKSRNGENQK